MKSLTDILSHDPECRISVCMATYNGEKFIGDQIRSILQQLSNRDELIVSDDSSQDRTLQILKGVNDTRIRIIENPGRKGVVPNFENALNAVRGRYVFLADQDDLWEPQKTATLLSLLTHYDLVVSDCSIIDEKGDVIHPSYFRLRRSGKGVCKNIFANTYMGACMAFKRPVLEKSLPFPHNICMHDWWIGLVGDIFGNTFFCPETLVRYRRHENNLSPPVVNDSFSLYQKLRMRAHIILPLARKWMEKNSLRY